MQVNIDLLKSDDHIQYEEMMQSSPYAQLYTSLKYKDLLEETIDAKSFYLLAKSKGELVGTLPLFLKKNPVYGNVLNSLPFYGCNGGITVKPGIDPQPVFKALIEALHSLAREMEVVVATIVTSPFERNGKFYKEYLKPDFRDDSHVSQVCFFPEFHPDSHSNIENIIETMIRSKTNSTVRMRNVRKARNAGVTYMHSSDPDALRFLISADKKNMENIGAPDNRLKFLKKIPEKFEYNTDYRIYIALLNGQLISALLLGYYNKIVEYMVPATKEDYLSLQPNSLLIFEAMKDAVKRGFKYWNFGGVSHEQESVYQFKKRWGTTDMPYHYYTVKYKDIGHLLELEPQRILVEYPFFYVVPFSELRKKTDITVSK